MADYLTDYEKSKTGRWIGIGAIVLVVLLGVIAIGMGGGGSPDLSPVAEDAGAEAPLATETAPVPATE